MKFRKSGFLLIDALLSLMIVSMLVMLLARSSMTKNKLELFIKEKETQLEHRELEWWHGSNEGCRDICLIDKLIYP